jgi:hypothetical protein
MKIAFDFVADETPLFVAVGEQLEKEGHKIFGLTLGKRWRQLWEGRFHTAPIINVPINSGTVDYPHDLKKEVERIEKEYGEFHPAAFLPSDRFLYAYDRQHQIIALVDTFRSIESFFDKQAPDIYFCTPIAYLFNLVSHAVCKRRGIPHISLYITRGSTPRFTYSTGVSCKWDPVSNMYHKLDSGISAADQKTIDNAKKKLLQFRSSPHRPYYMKTARANYKFRFIFIKEFITRLKYYYLDGWRGDKSDYMTKSPFWYAWRDTKKFVRANIFSLIKKHIFDSVEKDIPYYLFPLSMQPEASTLIYSEWYIDQLATIQNIARCLPFGTYLYIKEHTSAFGRRGLNFYKGVKKLHNVRLLAPWENTDSLIDNSCGVIVLSSTMGWESLMHGKPTYILGSLFCNDISPSIKANSYDELRQKIYNDYHSNNKKPMISDKSLISFMVSIQTASYPGMVGPAKLDIRHSVLAKGNIQQVTDGLKQIIADCCADKVQRGINRATL